MQKIKIVLVKVISKKYVGVLKLIRVWMYEMQSFC